MATSPIYNWPEPDNTDLVKNGALAIRTLGNAIDTTMATMTPKSIVDAKGDLIAATANDTPARLAVGNNGETLVADSATSTGLRYQGNYAAGKNKIINGNMNIWQRGTSFTIGGGNTYTADRWAGLTPFGDSVSASQQSFTAGAAPVTGYESQYFLRFNRSSGTSGYFFLQSIEDVRTFANQTVTLSFWAKASVAFTPTNIYLQQDFGSGGSGAVGTSFTSIQQITTSWVRYSYTVTLPSISGKTIGTNNCLSLIFNVNPGTASSSVDIWGVQVEAGSVATAFQTATGTIQGELAACQRYYWTPLTSSNNYTGYAYATNGSIYSIPFPVNMRIAPTSVITSGSAQAYALNTNTAVTPTFDQAGTSSAQILASHTITAGQGARLQLTTNTIAFSAEL